MTRLRHRFFNILIFCSLFLSFFLPISSFAQTTDVDVSTRSPESRVEVFLSPRSGSFTEGSTFQVPVLLNTNKSIVDKINIKINFDSDKLSIVQPSGGRSIVGFWEESPSYDNSKGTVSYIGTIPGGIATDSGLIGSITFKAINSGNAIISVNSNSKVFLDDGLQTSAVLDLGRAEYNILRKLSEGVNVFSETHPSSSKWYNNNNPVLSWQTESDVIGFSFELDNKPFTVPDNIIDSNETTKSFENIKDGVWYFHIKSKKNSIWGTTGHFIIKIDTVPPAEFTPKANDFLASAVLAGRTLISFFTTDNLSGVDHYEVGTIDKNQPITEAPVFIEAESPFQVPIFENSNTKVIVRAIDKAGNVRDSSIEVGPPFIIWTFLKNNSLLVAVVVALIVLVVFYLKRRNINPLKRASTFSILETDLRNYLFKRKQNQERNIIEKEKIETLEKALENVKDEMNNEIKDIK